MRFIPQFVFTWGNEPIDIRLGIMLGSQYDYILRGEKAVRCIRVDMTLGLVWACLRVGVIVHT